MPLFKLIKDEDSRKRADVIEGYLITLQTGFTANKDLMETLSDKYQKLVSGHGISGASDKVSDSNRPYWEVTELDTVALNKAKKELQKAHPD